MTFRVGVIIVAYNISGSRLQATLAAVMAQVARILVVDNSDEPGPALANSLPAQVDYHRNFANLGVAAAHNLGIDWAEQQGFSHLLLLDQDSLAGPDMVLQLLKPFYACASGEPPIALAGPAYTSLHSSQPPSFHIFRFPFSRRIYIHTRAPDALVTTDLLISSGALMSIKVARQVGKMREDFFIDRVDTDWCLRARARGYRLVGVCAARLTHRLGERSTSVWWGRWRRIPMHRPERYYYMVRNSLLLYRTSYSTWAWMFFDLSRLIGLLLLPNLGSEPGRIARIGYMWRGLIDGCLGRSGPIHIDGQRSSSGDS